MKNPPSIRYVNVGKVFKPTGEVQYIDLELTNTSAYTSCDADDNDIVGSLAQVAFSPNTQTNLRVYVRPSCATQDSCRICEELYRTEGFNKVEECYARGCDCFGLPCDKPYCCRHHWFENKQSLYKCNEMDSDMQLPGDAFVGCACHHHHPRSTGPLPTSDSASLLRCAHWIFRSPSHLPCRR